MQHVLFDISAHGFGHVAQTTVVINALNASRLRLTIRSMAPEKVLRARIKHPFTLIPYQQDEGMVMHTAMQVNPQATWEWYANFHANYAERCTAAARTLEQLQPDIIFANVPYLSLAAAAQVGIPSVAMCSLNWADLFQFYCGHQRGAERIHAQILDAYAQARYFLQATPSMPMSDLPNTLAIAPVALQGQAHKQALHNQSGINVQTGPTPRFILNALGGGIGIHYPLANWPVLPGVYWIFPDESLTVKRPDFIALSQFKMPYLDILASCDLVVAKTGYGIQTEAVIHQKPLLCVDRLEWPEQPWLVDWHRHHGVMELISWPQLQSGQFGDTIMALLATTWDKPVIEPHGAREAASILHSVLAGATALTA